MAPVRSGGSRKPLKIVLYCLYCALIILVPTELFVRYYLIPSQEYGYLQTDAAKFPFFRLKENFSSPGVTVRSGRRELQDRGGRARKVAFVGDSVTFGTHLGDADSYVEQVQSIQELYDAYNFGVPGYGLLEIESVITRLAREKCCDAIVYTFNFNDVHAGMTGLLPLLENASNRFASMDEYDGWLGGLKQLGKDHFKILYVLKYTWSNLSLWKSAPAPVAAEPRPPCYGDILAMSEDETYQKPNRLWRVMYRDPQLIAKLGKQVRGLKTQVQSSGGRFFVAVSYDLLMFEEGTDETYRSIMDDVLRGVGVEVIDTHPLYREHYKECEFYADPRHLGRMGSRLLAELVHANLLKRLFEPPSGQ